MMSYFVATVGAAYSDIGYCDMPLIVTNLAGTYSNIITQRPSDHSDIVTIRV